MIYVYEIYNTDKQCVYVGTTKRPVEREKEHTVRKGGQFLGCEFAIVAQFDKNKEALEHEDALKIKHGHERLEHKRAVKLKKHASNLGKIATSEDGWLKEHQKNAGKIALENGSWEKAIKAAKIANTSLSYMDVLLVKRLYDTGKYYQKDIAKIFGVSQPTINKYLKTS